MALFLVENEEEESTDEDESADKPKEEKTVESEWQTVVVGQDEKKRVMNHSHKNLAGGGHFGMNRTVSKVSTYVTDTIRMVAIHVHSSKLVLWHRSRSGTGGRDSKKM